MGEATQGIFVDAFVNAPIGVALLARLEAKERHDVKASELPRDADPRAVDASASRIDETSFDRLAALALDTARTVGPWAADAPRLLASAYRSAKQRRPIAEAISDRFERRFHSPIDFHAEQWWHSSHAETTFFDRPRFHDFTRVYGNGEFTWDGLWTVTSPPPGIHDELIASWEMLSGPISRWLLPVHRTARIWNVNHPTDWARLVENYPRIATGPHAGWELPGPNQQSRSIRALLSIPAQRAARDSVTRHVLPDWQAFARDYDGVHLSWAGFVTTEGYITDLNGGGETMLRYWASERTLWLADVFGDPVPLGSPNLSGLVAGVVGADVRHDALRQSQDSAVLSTLLDR